jgi:hypothetical protein
MKKFITVLVNQLDTGQHEYLHAGEVFSDLDRAVEWCKERNNRKWPAWGIYTLLEDGRILGCAGEIKLTYSTKRVYFSEEYLRQALNDSKLELVILSLPKEGDSRKLVAGMIVEQTEAISVLLQLSRMQIPAHLVLLPVSQTGNCVHKIEDFVSIYARIPE